MILKYLNDNPKLNKSIDLKKLNNLYSLVIPCLFKRKEIKMNIKLFGDDKFITNAELILENSININDVLYKLIKFKSILKLSFRVIILQNNKNTSALSSSHSLNNSLTNSNSASFNTNPDNSVIAKKITIKDLCPEEKAKIGELLKKLADEKDEKEKLKQMVEEEKRLYESQIDDLRKEK
jgi:hypothetical protein